MGNTKKERYPIIVIGAGAGGLVIAIGAAKGGKKVLLIEKGNYGGDCTNFGCIPSKSLISSAHIAHALIDRAKYGINAITSNIKCDQALERTRKIVESVRKHETPEALGHLGVDTLTGIASFIDPNTLKVKITDDEEYTVIGDQIVIATGSHPRIPNIVGIDSCTYRTNENIFDLEKIPKRLGVIGGGPIGCELAQAFQRLGSEVTLIHHSPQILKKEEIEAQTILSQKFKDEGMKLKLNYETTKIIRKKDQTEIEMKCNETGYEEVILVDELLVSVGRIPSINQLQLDQGNIHHTAHGIQVDSYGRTNQKHIWAVGDVTGRAIFTHVAENEGRSVLKNLLVPWIFQTKLDKKQAIPRVTFTDPEIASAGLQESQAIKKYGKDNIAVYTLPFDQLDRAITTSRTEGFIKVVTKKWSSRILGFTIISPRAGEMLPQLTLAMKEKIPLRKMASLIHPYPTYSLAIRKTADQWLTKTILPSILKMVGKYHE